MTSWSYLYQSVPWIIAGLVVGFFLGRSTVAVETIADAVQEEVDVPAVPRPLYRRITAIHIMGTFVVVLGIFTAVQGYTQGQATDRLTVCQQAYSNGFADAIDERSQASSEAQDALDDFLGAIRSVTPTDAGREQVRKAFDDYLAKRAAAKRAQAEHPFPPPPRDVCQR